MTMPYVSLIDDEARILSKYSEDLDNFRRFYSLKETASNEEILVQFVAPKIIAFEDYRFSLMQNSDTKPLSPSRYYRPDYVSYDEYGTPNLWALLLFINEIPTIEDFIVENILVPTKASIVQISTDVLKRDLLRELVPLKDYPLKPTASLFTRQKPIPLYKTQLVPPPVFIPSDMYFIRETHIVDVVMARERFIDLDYEPVVESVVLKIKNQPNYLYNKHYTMIKGTKGFNRLTWNPRLISKGIGLMNIMIENTEFEISYARKVKI